MSTRRGRDAGENSAIIRVQDIKQPSRNRILREVRRVQRRDALQYGRGVQVEMWMMESARWVERKNGKIVGRGSDTYLTADRPQP